jgi:hypothetical protein
MSIRVTGKAGLAGILISRYFVMLVGQLAGVIVLMAVYTTKQSKITRGSMAFAALVPFAIVFSAIDWEILAVMVKS